ncbi:Uncharacterised protein [Vibrio cholerae]|uniref:Uncharacterized protein n=1 Tax=Vibrio cholerae TaxID=666 RepID=A0A655Y5W4_VIBCL|nr:Uncharacterised protein [Vibrio cholerae]CSA70679.1 Uncharacterised protein [Vibrio cholerae]CSB92773.1 Uncharacterised protein [Vibrio cholerae]CSC20254.1 Uncharacterised protein [Vibrio cholerae]CSC31251.1 Uncharacterised protein [Vibrio cholerae]
MGRNGNKWDHRIVNTVFHLSQVAQQIHPIAIGQMNIKQSNIKALLLKAEFRLLHTFRESHLMTQTG